jgi:NTP pyrophosphatase (non-canonical NTP hydrolase)
MTKDQVIEKVFEELRKAEEKFPGWPDDPVHGAAIVAEEAGELQKAALDFYYGRHLSADEMKKEAAQTAAMGIRFLLGLKFYYKERDADGVEHDDVNYDV